MGLFKFVIKDGSFGIVFQKIIKPAGIFFRTADEFSSNIASGSFAGILLRTVACGGGVSGYAPVKAVIHSPARQRRRQIHFIFQAAESAFLNSFRRVDG